MPTLNNIIEELKNVPVNRLEDIYSVIFSLREGKTESGKKAADILAFAGAFGDMPEKDYEEFAKHTRQTRRELFDRDFNL